MSDRVADVAVVPGSGTPLTASGRSIAYRPPPWNMRGRTLALWFRLANPDEARKHVPGLLGMDPDPVLRARFWDMAHDGVPAYAPGASEPVRAWTTFREAVVAFPVWHGGVEADYPTYMYADEFGYTAFGREVMGWPVRDGHIDVDPEPAGGPVSGLHLGGRLERGGRTVMQVQLTLTGACHAADDTNVPRWLASKVITDVGTPRAAIAQLVATGPERIHHRDIWEATGTLSFGEGATDELHVLAPREVIAAQYWTNVDLTIGWGTVLEELGEGVWDG